MKKDIRLDKAQNRSVETDSHMYLVSKVELVMVKDNKNIEMLVFIGTFCSTFNAYLPQDFP